MANNKKVYFIEVLGDLISLVGKWFWIISFALFLITLGVERTCGNQINYGCLTQQIVNSIPTLMGFLITGLAIIMGLNEGTLKRLSEPANDGKIPLRVIVACFVVCFGFLLLSLLLSLLYNNIDCKCECIGFLALFCTFESILSLFHVIFHIFSTSTHLVIKK